MKKLALLTLATALAACGSDSPTSPTTGPIVFTSALSAANEVPPITNADANGRGTVTMTLNVERDSSGAPTSGGTMNFVVQLSGLPAGTGIRGAHLHPGAAGVNGPITVDTGVSAASPVTLADGTGTLTFNDVTVSLANAQAINSNPAGWYFNVHSLINPGGAVRGQLVKQ